MQRILILKGDLVCADALRATAERLFPRAAVVVMSAIERAEAVLSAMPFDLLVTGLDLPDGDALDFLFTYVKSLRRVGRVLVVTQHHEQRVLETLRVWQVDGVFDPSIEGPHGFEQALRAVAAGRPYWSARQREHVELKIFTGKSLGLVLTPGEIALLGAIGDGSDNLAGARLLGISEHTVATMRRDLHHKLKLHHRGDVVQFAVQNGFVRFSRGGIVRPGFEHARAEYFRRRHRKRSAQVADSRAA